MSSTQRRADEWSGPTAEGRTSYDDGVQPEAIHLPGVIQCEGGPWRAFVVRTRGTTAKGNATTREAAVLERHGYDSLGHTEVVRIRAEPATHLRELERLALRLNGWEVGRYFPPDKPERWRAQNHLPPEPGGRPCPTCGRSPANP